jgi:hypothetical protein
VPSNRIACTAASAVAWLAFASPLSAQGPQAFTLADTAVTIGLSPQSSHLRFASPQPVPAAEFSGADSLPCPQCNPRKHFWVAVAEVMAVNLIPNLVSRSKDAEWAKFTLKSWGDNLTLPWQWDNNAFLNNQFSHPYHGAMYFNSARTNGYNFWQSAPWAFAGSLTWELFGEVWAPAPNDLANTTLGGITLGEMLYRVSSLTLDNEATGFDRVVREVTAGLLNPVRGFNRVVRGEAWKVSRTPPEWRQSTIFGAVDAGYRRISVPGEDENVNLDGVFFTGQVVYGDGLLDLSKKPFSFFRAEITVASNNGTAGRLASLMVRGSLAARKLGDGGLNQLAGFMTYDYISNPAIEFGGQGFYFGPVLGHRPSNGPRIRAEMMGQFMPVAAVQSDFYLTAEGRDYDYGIGLGGLANANVIWPGLAQVGIYGRYVFLPIISGFPGDHQLLFTGATGRIYWKGRIGVGADYNLLRRWSNYYGRAEVNRKNNELRLYLTTSIPQWRD